MKQFSGKVISAKMSKTVVVELERQVKHKLYKKILKRTKKIKAHNEDLSLKEGDLVKVVATRPISKEKHFKVIKKI
ncbi:30S ribosomal protein S17 [Candidatus Gottesmanbacteria bacterium RBG_16_37_8]|uniref:Small ribosomal subunit protein uS17 n=1 Tax=Candidatus Gottesmanbacteria bacterium RBG_16_37_8 TaxID=1798371 RepID=A0A1F5YVC7_9BACT|nr:MAG: 30S ribosomal protein S17 [Candidatus Gottesmanbacteria bacterium RBG_16_37_8]